MNDARMRCLVLSDIDRASLQAIFDDCSYSCEATTEYRSTDYHYIVPETPSPPKPGRSPINPSQCSFETNGVDPKCFSTSHSPITASTCGLTLSVAL